MKKNVMRIISLALVAVMVFAFASCKQEILVRFVDANGNDLFQGGSINTGVNTTPVEDTTAAPVEDTTAAPVEGTTAAPVENTTAAPVENTTAAPVENTTAAPVENTTAAPVENTTKAPEQTTAAPAPSAPSSNAPSTKQDIVNFYAKAANDLKNNGSAGYTKKEWQSVDNINIGSAIVNNAVSGVLGSFMTKEEAAEEQINAKGSDDAKRRAFGWTLTDLSKVASAKCETLPNGNYKITIVMVDEDTPKKEGSMLGQVTGALLYWEDIETTLTSDSTVTAILKEFDNIHVVYKGYTIVAEMTPDGKFVTLDHLADVDINLGHIKILAFSLDNKYGHMNNYCKFYNFQY